MKKAYKPYIATLFTVIPLSATVVLVGTIRSIGIFSPDFFEQCLLSWGIIFPIAYIGARIYGKFAMKITEKFNWKE